MTNTTITLSAEQISLLLQVLSESQIHPRERDLAEEVIEILEDAENFLCDLESRMDSTL